VSRDVLIVMKQNSQTAAAHATTFEPPPPLDLSPMRSEETDGKRPCEWLLEKHRSRRRGTGPGARA